MISGIFDAPAKSLFQNMLQFNGKYGCSYCYDSGETFKTSARGHCHIYPFKTDTASGHSHLRTHKETMEYANEAVTSGQRLALKG